ncbi:MAG: hypothetical protein GY854_02065 [Deltaproteobacteria bacterium]|nr:hypothetical protein [Deltaproteobacteria bacterium]
MTQKERPDSSQDVLIEPTAIDRWPRGIACEDGFRILGTPIGFGRAKGASLRFISHVDEPTPTRGTRVLTTPFIATALDWKRRGLDALTLGYDRKIRLGRMDIRLLPAGLGPGAAQLEVSFKERRIVFMGGIRLAGPIASPAAEFPECDLLLLDTGPAEPRPPSPKRATAQIVEWLNSTTSLGRVPVLAAGSLTAAIDVAWSLRNVDISIRACRSLFEMLRRIEEVGYSLPRLKRLEQELPKGEAVLHLGRVWPDLSMASEKSAAAAYVGPGRAKPPWAEVAFRLGEGEDRPGLVTYVKKTGASQVAVGPRCDEATAVMLRKAGVSVYRVSDPTQLPLPF